MKCKLKLFVYEGQKCFAPRRNQLSEQAGDLKNTDRVPG